MIIASSDVSDVRQEPRARDVDFARASFRAPPRPCGGLPEVPAWPGPPVRAMVLFPQQGDVVTAWAAHNALVAHCDVGGS